MKFDRPGGGMIVIVDDRQVVRDGFVSLFARCGVSATALTPGDCDAWVGGASAPDLLAVEAFLLDQCGDRRGIARSLRGRSSAAAIAVNEGNSLADTLDLFDAGCDDVVRKPIHVRELLARITAIRRRARQVDDFAVIGDLKVFCDGRDPHVCGQPLVLPRRQRRILEYLVVNKNHWLTKPQIFNAVYGVFGHEIDESVIESHVSRLRKRLRVALGHDVIAARRFFGYRIADDRAAGARGLHRDMSRPAAAPQSSS